MRPTGHLLVDMSGLRGLAASQPLGDLGRRGVLPGPPLCKRCINGNPCCPTCNHRELELTVGRASEIGAGRSYTRERPPWNPPRASIFTSGRTATNPCWSWFQLELPRMPRAASTNPPTVDARNLAPPRRRRTDARPKGMHNSRTKPAPFEPHVSMLQRVGWCKI